MSNQTKVSEAKNQHDYASLRTTIPKAIAKAMRLKKGDSLEWLFEKGDVIVRKV